MGIYSLHNLHDEFPLRGMELRYSLLCGGMNKLTTRKSHKPPYIKQQMESIPRRGNYRKARYNYEV